MSRAKKYVKVKMSEDGSMARLEEREEKNRKNRKELKESKV